jgi:hypothetical protein
MSEWNQNKMQYAIQTKTKLNQNQKPKQANNKNKQNRNHSYLQRHGKQSLLLLHCRSLNVKQRKAKNSSLRTCVSVVI